MATPSIAIVEDAKVVSKIDGKLVDAVFVPPPQGPRFTVDTALTIMGLVISAIVALNLDPVKLKSGDPMEWMKMVGAAVYAVKSYYSKGITK